MKVYQKILALFLVLLMSFALSGCNVITITKTAANMGDLDSVSADLNLDLDMDMTMMEESTPLKITVSGPLDIDLDNDKGKADLTVDLMGEKLTLLLYFEKLEDVFTIYTSADNGESWTKNETSLNDEQEKGSSEQRLRSSPTPLRRPVPRRSAGRMPLFIPEASSGKTCSRAWISLPSWKRPALPPAPPPVRRLTSAEWI